MWMSRYYFNTAAVWAVTSVFDEVFVVYSGSRRPVTPSDQYKTQCFELIHSHVSISTTFQLTAANIQQVGNHIADWTDRRNCASSIHGDQRNRLCTVSSMSHDWHCIWRCGISVTHVHRYEMFSEVDKLDSSANGLSMFVYICRTQFHCIKAIGNMAKVDHVTEATEQCGWVSLSSGLIGCCRPCADKGLCLQTSEWICLAETNEHYTYMSEIIRTL